MVTVEPLGLTEPVSVAPVAETETGGVVVTVGRASVVNDSVELTTMPPRRGDGAEIIGRAGESPVSVPETAVRSETLGPDGVAATDWGDISTTRLLSVSATKTSPAASTATPCGSLNPEPIGLMVPSGRTSLTTLFPLSATKTSPEASTATPAG